MEAGLKRLSQSKEGGITKSSYYVNVPIESATAAVVAVPRLVVRVNESCLPVLCSWLNTGTGSRLSWPLIARGKPTGSTKGKRQQEIRKGEDWPEQ